MVDLDQKGACRLLGECFIILGPLTASLTDINGSGVRSKLKFIRKKGNKESTVGRVVVNLKLVGENDIPIDHYDQKHNMR